MRCGALTHSQVGQLRRQVSGYEPMAQDLVQLAQCRLLLCFGDRVWRDNFILKRYFKHLCHQNLVILACSMALKQDHRPDLWVVIEHLLGCTWEDVGMTL